MAVSRSHLHLSKLDEFAAWAATQGYERQPTKGVYEVLRLKGANPVPFIYYRRATSEHASIPNNPQGAWFIVERWLRWKRQQTKQTEQQP